MRRVFLPTIGFFTLFMSPHASAQGIISTGIPGCNFESGLVTAACVPNMISHIIAIIFGLIGGIAAIMIVISGYQVALAKATGRDRSEGLTRLRVAIIGFILCAFSWYILDFIIASLAGI